MYLYRNDTLAYFKNSLALGKNDFSEVYAETVGLAANSWAAPQFNEYNSHPRPEAHALEFYTLNHIFSELQRRYHPHEVMHPKDAALADLYLRVLTNIGRRIFFYLTLISTRESRHLHASKGGIGTKLKKKYGEEFSTFHQSIRGKESFKVAHMFMQGAPKMPIGKYFEAITLLFNEGAFGGGYGGPKWGKISHTAEQYVKGETSLEIMIDTSWTLAHNGGVVFDKGMLYRSEYNHGNELKTILDVQRSGQTLQLLHSLVNNEIKLETITSNIPPFWATVAERFPELDTYCDWFKVENLGSIKSYPAQKKAQVALHGKPVKSKEEIEKEQKIKIQETEKALNALKLEESKVYLTESDFIYKSERKKAA